jgi:hypothetical protein
MKQDRWWLTRGDTAQLHGEWLQHEKSLRADKTTSVSLSVLPANR